MEDKEKELYKLKFGLALKRILRANEEYNNEKPVGSKKADLVTSLHELSSTSGIEYKILQEVSIGKRNATNTTIAAILEGLSISWGELGNYYDIISEKEVWKYKESIEEARHERLKKKQKQVKESKKK